MIAATIEYYLRSQKKYQNPPNNQIKLEKQKFQKR
jgi:hypothetical protein